MSQPSNLTAQMLIDYARTFSWTTPAIGVSGYSQEPAVSFLDDVVKKILAKSNPWKWNEQKAPVFYTQPYQQDYPTSISQSMMGWLSACTMIDINNSTSQPPIQPPVNCVARLQPTSVCGNPSKICWITNNMAITGQPTGVQWPGPGVNYVNPLVSAGGGPSNNPNTAITDLNGNIQVVYTYGTTGASQPSWPVSGATPGTITPDGTNGLSWILIDPNGIAFRLDRLATFNSNVWQLNCNYQLKPPNILNLKQTVAPIPDDLSYLVKQGFLAYCYKQVDNNKFQTEFAQWLQDIQEAMEASDREYQEYGFAPTQGLAGNSSAGTGSYGYPGWNGWQSDGQ
jgi:hypothetical protein